MGFVDFRNTPQNRPELSCSKSLLPSWLQFRENPTYCFSVSCFIYLVYLIDFAMLIWLSPAWHIRDERAICEQIFSR